MKYFKLANGIILVLFCFLCETLCDLRLSGVNCGSKVCKSHEYCSQFDHQCKSCSEICDQRIHNYEPSLCMSDCQGKNIFFNYKKFREKPHSCLFCITSQIVWERWFHSWENFIIVSRSRFFLRDNSSIFLK